MKQDLAQNLIEAGMGTGGSVIQGPIQCASSIGEGKQILMLACVATDREMAKSFLKLVREVEAGLNSQGYTTILQARIPDGGPMETFRPNRSRQDDCIDMSQTRSGQWQFNGRDASGKQSVAADCNVRPNRRKSGGERESLSQPVTRILPFPIAGSSKRGRKPFQFRTLSCGPEAA